MTQRFRITIDGRHEDSASGQWLACENPFDGSTWAEVPRCDARDVDRAVDAARRAGESGPWAEASAAQRGAWLRRAGELMDERAEMLAALETRDTGKRIAESVPQMRGLRAWFDYYAGLADKIEGAVVPADPSRVFNYTVHEPLGVVAAITPWNSPLMIGAWKLAPALAAGNTVVIKPSEHASASTLAFMDVFRDAGFPAGVVNVITGLPAECGEALVAHPDVAKISFTGSEHGGRAINTRAAADFKRVTMELGGKSPQIVFDDARIDNAVHGVLSGIFLSNGQTCVAGSRLYLHRAIRDGFLERLLGALQGLKMGDPFDPSTRIGPVANRMQFDKVLSFIDAAHAAGGRCLAGGRAVRDEHTGQGLFIEPTVFDGLDATHPLACEEVFGPVLAVFDFDDEDEVVALANDSPYGLAAGVWTSDYVRATRMARRIRSGTVYINSYRAVSVTSPVGGYKLSGFGRENGIEAIYEFLQTKSVWMGLEENLPNPLA